MWFCLCIEYVRTKIVISYTNSSTIWFPLQTHFLNLKSEELNLPFVKTTSRRQGYTKRYPFWVQIVQLHLLTGYLGNGHLSVTSNWTAPQWQDALCVVRSASEVSSTTMRMLRSRGRVSFGGTDIMKDYISG